MRHVRSRGENIWSGQRIDRSEKILFNVNAHPIPESTLRGKYVIGPREDKHRTSDVGRTDLIGVNYGARRAEVYLKKTS